MRSYLFRHPSFNLINLHIVLLETAVLIGGLFLLAYLLRAGFSVPAALAVTAATFLLRMSLRGFSSAVIRRFGLRKSMMIGSGLYVVRFALLPFVSGVDFWLLAFVAAESAAAAVYWMSYHLYFAHLSSHAGRGSQVAGQAVARIVAGTAAPLLGGFLLAYFHSDVSVAACALLIGVGAWVLARMPRIALPTPAADADGRAGAPRRALLLSAGHSLLEAGTVWLWPLIVFFATGEQFQLTGVILAILPLGMAVLSHFVGDRIDRGFGHRMWPWILVLHVAAIIATACFATGLWQMVAAGLVLACTNTLLVPVADTALYDLTADSSDSLRSIRWSESGWDGGTIAGLSLAAVLTGLGVDLRLAMVVCALGAGLLAYVFSRHYAARPVLETA